MSIEEKVIEKFKEKHLDEYDYSLMIYINNKIKVKIICKKHDIFEQTPHHHKRGGGCQKCANVGARRLTNEEFINKANIKHNNKYEYSISNYTTNRCKVKVMCNEHGIFEPNAGQHLNGQGCPKCILKYTNRNIILDKFNEKHLNLYKYILDKEQYNLKDYINIECSIHGIFSQTISNHISGNGCPLCAWFVFNTNDFINKANLIHHNKYDYSLVVYEKHDIEIDIICKKHGIFKQKPVNHTQGSGCHKCNESKGETIIREYLLINNIKFEAQKKFNDCINKRRLPFDFFLPEYNICIEYNGIQH